jgi:hypothetical protein
VASVTGEDHAFRSVEFADLRTAVETHCKGDDRRDIPAWIRRTAAEFVKAVQHVDGGAKFYAGNGPSAMIRWYNASGRPGKIAAVKRAAPNPIQLETFKETPESKAARERLERSLGHGGS